MNNTKRFAAMVFLCGLTIAAALSGRNGGNFAGAATRVVATAKGDVIVGAFCWFAPSPRSALAAEPPQAAKEFADLVLTGGIIYTVDAARPRVEAVAVRGERIVAVGTAKEIQSWVGPNTRVVDLKGRFAMPGFNDAHVHLANGGQAKLAVSLEGSRSVGEMQQRIRDRLKDYQPGEWVTGRGWDHTLWPEKKFPTRRDLDTVSKEHPMIFGRVDGHVAIANSLALKLAGITKGTKNPEGGEIERDASGEPTGMLKEGPALGMVFRKVPELSAEQRRRGIQLALAEAARFGVTSIQDNSGWNDFLLYEELKREGKLTARISEWLPFDAPLERLEELRKHGGTTDPWLRTAGLKGVVDGALGVRTAAMLAPYSDQANASGILIIPEERLKQMVVERDAAGFQINLHAIGDRANRAALDAFEAAMKARQTREAVKGWDPRHRIEHAQIVAPADFPRFAALSVIASMQPCHQTTDSRWAAERVGPERVQGAYAWKWMQRVGARLAFGTDYPVEPITPFRGLYACVTREVDGQPGSSWQPQEKIPLDDCLRGYTADSAYAEHAEKDKGRIAAGQLADIIVLSNDLTQIPPRQILRTDVLMTIVGGRLVYEKK
ncbi:MAG: amidohydrolase family protein [Acidobacteria bacterium]|nr:amidohydrolase family protein [Acidobacteriota bacterium]MBI3663165.1 amidohydrolase family protein [Acidobacteriota bacterium]